MARLRLQISHAFLILSLLLFTCIHTSFAACVINGQYFQINITTEVDLSSSGLQQVPEELQCFAGSFFLTRIDLGNNSITSVPLDFFQNFSKLESLDLSMNEIEQIDARMFSDCSALKTLRLDYNKITELPSHTFNGMRLLNYLFLRGNRITTIGDSFLTVEYETIFFGLDVFLPRLLTVDLRDNALTSIGLDTFNGTLTQRLRLDNNQISSVEPYWISPLRSIMAALEMPGNHLGSLPEGSFGVNHSAPNFDYRQFTQNITFVNLQLNDIATVDLGAFDSYTGISYLDLGRNDLTSVPPVFSSPDPRDILPNVHTLDVHDNDIDPLPADALTNLPRLQTLYAYANNITAVDVDAFTGLSVIEEILLAINNIEFLENGTFTSLDSLKTVFLSDNPIPCVSTAVLNPSVLLFGKNFCGITPSPSEAPSAAPSATPSAAPSATPSEAPSPGTGTAAPVTPAPSSAATWRIDLASLIACLVMAIYYV